MVGWVDRIREIVSPDESNPRARLVKPPFAYYGGKARLASWIVSMMPAHRVYIEPFAGSAAVLFAKAPSTHEVLNDVDGDVVNFFAMLRTRLEDLELVCRLTPPYARDEYHAARGADLDLVTDPIERARLWWVRSTQSFGETGSANTGWSISLAQSCCRPRQLYNRLGRFAWAAERLLPVFIENADGLEVIGRYACRDAVMYVDPPYLGDARSSFAGGRRPSGDYRYEFATEAEHRTLFEVLADTPATVILSGYPSGLYEDLYHRWWRIDRPVRRPSSNGLTAGDHRAVEVIWTNRPPPGDLFSGARVSR